MSHSQPEAVLDCPFAPACTFATKERASLSRHVTNCHAEQSSVDIATGNICPYQPVCTYRAADSYTMLLHVETEHTSSSPFIVNGDANEPGQAFRFQFQDNESAPSSSSSTSNKASSSKNSEADPEIIQCDFENCSEYISTLELEEHMAACHTGHSMDFEVSETGSDASSLAPRTPPRRKSPMAPGEDSAEKRRRLVRGTEIKRNPNRDRDLTQDALDELELDNYDSSYTGNSPQDPILISASVASSPPIPHDDPSLTQKYDPDFARSYYEPSSSRTEQSKENTSKPSLRRTIKEPKKPSLLKAMLREKVKQVPPKNDVSTTFKNAATPKGAASAVGRKPSETKANFGGYASTGRSTDEPVQSSRSLRGPRLSRKELGPHANEERAPEKVLEVLRKGGQVEQIKLKTGGTTDKIITYRDENGDDVSVPKINNETPGLIPLLARLSEIEPDQPKTYLCHPGVKHVTKESKLTNHFCGYRTIQMMFSYFQVVKVAGAEQYHGEKLATVSHLQESIEDAWSKGIEAHNKVDTGGVLNTRRFIGTGEAVAVIKNLGIGKVVKACHGKDGKIPSQELFEFVEDHFKKGTENIPGDIVYTDNPPMYLQYPGHSIAIVGVQRWLDGMVSLLVLDSARPTPKDIMTLLESKDLNKSINEYKNPEKILDKYRIFPRDFKSKRQFEIACIIPQTPAGEEPDPSFSLYETSSRAKPHQNSMDPSIRKRIELLRKARNDSRSRGEANRIAGANKARAAKSRKARKPGRKVTPSPTIPSSTAGPKSPTEKET